MEFVIVSLVPRNTLLQWGVCCARFRAHTTQILVKEATWPVREIGNHLVQRVCVESLEAMPVSFLPMSVRHLTFEQDCRTR